MPRRVKRLSAVEVMDALSPEYGPFHWEPRYDPASELVYTILSQHTSDINSERAFNNLMTTFGNLEAIASADVEADRGCHQAGGPVSRQSATDQAGSERDS